MTVMWSAISMCLAASAAFDTQDPAGMNCLAPTSAIEMAEFSNRDKTGTTTCHRVRGASQTIADSALTKRRSFRAEGTGLEPATPCGASHFQCDR
jgi:hypothetical protein